MAPPNLNWLVLLANLLVKLTKLGIGGATGGPYPLLEPLVAVSSPPPDRGAIGSWGLGLVEYTWERLVPLGEGPTPSDYETIMRLLLEYC